MIIAVDLRGFDPNLANGVSVYTYNILINLFKLDQTNQYKLFLNRQNLSTNLAKLTNKNLKIYKFNIPNKLLNSSTLFFNYPKFDQLVKGADLYWLPNLNFIALTNNCRLLITVHDLSFKLMPELYSLKGQLWHGLINPKKIFLRSQKIVCVSANTKNDLFKYYDVPANKIEVLNPISEDVARINLNNFKPTKNFFSKNVILNVATFEPRKNIESIIYAFNKLINKYPAIKKHWQLIICGRPGWRQGLINKELKKNRDNLLILQNLSNEELMNIYRQAKIFIWPSFYEGFGFPPHEALMNNAKIIILTSFNSSLVEYLPRDAIFLNPFNLEEIYQALKIIINSQNQTNQPLNYQLNNSIKINWLATAQKFLKIINSVN